MLSLVQGSVTNNNRVLGWMIGFTDSFFVQSLFIAISYKNSQPIFSRTLLHWLPRTRPILVLVLWLTVTVLRLTLISSRHGPRTENTALLLLRACLLVFPRDRYPSSPLARCLLPTNGLGVNHTENTAPVLLAACLFESVYLGTGISGFID
jgi:hypothetical protein